MLQSDLGQILSASRVSLCIQDNTISAMMLNYWNIPESERVPANVVLSESSWSTPPSRPSTHVHMHPKYWPKPKLHITLDSKQLKALECAVQIVKCGVCKYTYQWWGTSVCLFISNKDLYLWVSLWFICSCISDYSCLHIHKFTIIHLFPLSYLKNISIMANKYVIILLV